MKCSVNGCREDNVVEGAGPYVNRETLAPLCAQHRRDRAAWADAVWNRMNAVPSPTATDRAALSAELAALCAWARTAHMTPSDSDARLVAVRTRAHAIVDALAGHVEPAPVARVIDPCARCGHDASAHLGRISSCGVRGEECSCAAFIIPEIAR